MGMSTNATTSSMSQTAPVLAPTQVGPSPVTWAYKRYLIPTEISQLITDKTFTVVPMDTLNGKVTNVTTQITSFTKQHERRWMIHVGVACVALAACIGFIAATLATGNPLFLIGFCGGAVLFFGNARPASRLAADWPSSAEIVDFLKLLQILKDESLGGIKNFVQKYELDDNLILEEWLDIALLLKEPQENII